EALGFKNGLPRDETLESGALLRGCLKSKNKCDRKHKCVYAHRRGCKQIAKRKTLVTISCP
ncbi:hypothetical protein, partial [Moorena sp. SIO4G3]|uniref:hypothetical protein n=1 Tax=Moorena sp. SIO4G3 TaxID=2607821 RepID=UPI0025E6C74D